MEAAGRELQQFQGQLSGKEEKEVETRSDDEYHPKRGGWTTFPFSLVFSPFFTHPFSLCFLIGSLVLQPIL